MGAWGYGLFQSDHDFDIVENLSHEAGCSELEKNSKAKAPAKDGTEGDGGAGGDDQRVFYSIYSGCCSDPGLVRSHLDSGILEKMIKQKEAKLLTTPDPKNLEWYDPCYIYVLLGACAMSLGCRLPDHYLSMLKKVYKEGGLMPDAQKQMRKALFGPDGFQNGTVYDFKSKGLVETANSDSSAQQPNASGFIGMNVIGPGGLFDTGMGDSTTSAIIKELRAKHEKPGSCGSCGLEQGENGEALLVCSRCKDRKYCSKNCQKTHWKAHKTICEPAGH